MKLLKELLKRRKDSGLFYDYSLMPQTYNTIPTKIKAKCIRHDTIFEQWMTDHLKDRTGCRQCINEKYKDTCVKRYGDDNTFKTHKNKIKQTIINKYGVDNPSKSPHIKLKKKNTHESHYNGYRDIIEKTKNTNKKRYGVEYWMQVPENAKKTTETRIKNGSFTKSNSSAEATVYFRQYIEKKGYFLEQVAYADHERGIHEWGWNYRNKWYLFDFVVFENGFRGQKDKIIEIIEYNGPFHYLEIDKKTKGKDKKAFPWKNCNVSIEQSIVHDKVKLSLAKRFTSNVTVVWPPKYFSQFDIYQNQVREFSLYPGVDTIEGLKYAVLGLVGEAGEIANKVKKIMRDQGNIITQPNKEQLLDELGDVLFYVAAVAAEISCPLSVCATKNLEKLSGRKIRGTIQGSGDNR